MGIFEKKAEEVEKNNNSNKDKKYIEEALKASEKLTAIREVNAAVFLSVRGVRGYQLRFLSSGGEPGEAVAFIFDKLTPDVLKFITQASLDDNIKKPLHSVTNNALLVKGYKY